MKIEYDYIGTLAVQIRSSIDRQMRHSNAPRNEIRVLMPQHIIHAFEHYYDQSRGPRFGYFDLSPEEQKDNIFYCGVKILPHYLNEIVIYFVNFGYYKHLDCPIVITLPHFGNEYAKFKITKG